MQAALAAVSELVRALGRLVRWVGWASGWSMGRLPAMPRHCLWAGSRAGLALAASGRGWSGQAALAIACWPVRAGLGKLVGQLGWTSGWLVPTGGRLGLALIDGLSYRVEAGVEQPGWASCPVGKSKPPKSARTKEAIAFEITRFTKRCPYAAILRDPTR